MHVGIVAEYIRPWPGGISEHVHYEAIELARRGHRVTVLSGPSSDPEPTPLPYRIRRLGRAIRFSGNGAQSQLALGADLLRWNAWLRRQELDVLHVHAPFDPVLPLWSVLCSPCPVVGTWHASHARTLAARLLYESPWASRAANRLATVIAVSDEARRTLRLFNRLANAPLQVIPNGVDVARFALPRAHRSEGPPTRFLFVGRNDPRKGLDLLLRAFQRARAQGAKATLTVVGPNTEGPQQEGVMFAGPKSAPTPSSDALVAAFAAADVLCAPSTGQESQGIVLLEALAAGLTVVASDIPGYRETLQHGGIGYLLPPLDVERWSQVFLAPPGPIAPPAVVASYIRTYDWANVAERIEAVLLEASKRS